MPKRYRNREIQDYPKWLTHNLNPLVENWMNTVRFLNHERNFDQFCLEQHQYIVKILRQQMAEAKFYGVEVPVTPPKTFEFPTSEEAQRKENDYLSKRGETAAVTCIEKLPSGTYKLTVWADA